MEPQRDMINPAAVKGQPLQSSGAWNGDLFHLVPAEPDGLLAEGGDAYLVIDDLDDRVAVLVVSPWPVTDEFGRARFTGPESFQLAVDRDDFTEVVIRARRRDARGDLHRLAVDRPLRIGDVFRASASTPSDVFEQLRQTVAGLGEGIGRVDVGALAWLHLVDVTDMARGAAKLAFYSAVAPAMDETTYARVVAQEHEDPRVAGPEMEA